MYDAVASAFVYNTKHGWATETHFTRRNGQLIGSSTSAAYDPEREEMVALGIRVEIAMNPFRGLDVPFTDQ